MSKGFWQSCVIFFLGDMLDTINPVNIPETISFTTLADKVNSPTLLGLFEEPDKHWA